MSLRIFTCLVLFYIFMIIFTWGHMLNNEDLCKNIPSKDNSTYAVANAADCRSGVAIFTVWFWPFYWSWELQNEK